MTSFDVPSSLAAIALGSNLGDSLQILESALKVLSESPDISFVSRSQWYQTVAIGPPQPDYLNGCALIQMNTYSDSPKAPENLLKYLLEIEQQFGRVRRQPWGPRTLDLDLLLYDSIVLHTNTLTLPHPQLTNRAFVLVPLAELLPNWVEPVTGLTITQLRNRIDCSGVSLLET